MCMRFIFDSEYLTVGIVLALFSLKIKMAVQSTPEQEEHGYKVVLSESAKQGLQCPECSFILRDAVQTPEGVRLCDPCYRKLARLPKHTSPKSGISVAGEDGQPSCYPDKAVRREVQQLEVKCNNVMFGCPWIGILSYYFQTHQAQCKYTPVKCSNEGCGKLVPRDKLKHHLDEDCLYRDIHCEHCEEVTQPAKLQEHHAVCSKFPVRCEHCKKMVPRNELDDHNLQACPTVKCPCGALLKRDASASAKNSVESHLKKPAEVFYHILNITSLINTVVKSNVDIEKRLTAIENGGVKPSKKSVHQAELTKFKAEIQQNLQAITDRLSPLEQYQLSGASATSKDKNMNAKVTELQSKLRHIEEKNKQQELQIRTLQTQLQQRAVSSSLTTSADNVDQSRMIQLEKRYEDMERQVSMLKVHVSELELQLQASLASTHNGSFLWRIPDLSRRKRDAVEERITSIYSPPFYTGRNGYKMCIRAYLNGDGLGYKTHLSLFFVLMKGEFDALLKWPFDYKVSLILVDQNHRKHMVQTFKPTPESSSFQRPVSDMNVASGCPQFSKLSVLDDDSYVKDDVVYIKCIVDTSRIFHP